MGRAIRAFLCLAMLVWQPSLPALAAGRVALVIGNDTYEALPKLGKAVNDAHAVGAALRSMGFRVLRGENLTRRATDQTLADFVAAIAPGDLSFVFFAGLGVALDGESYLLPTDLRLAEAGAEDRVRKGALAVSDLLRRVTARLPANAVFVLDASRDDPFAASAGRRLEGGGELPRATWLSIPSKPNTRSGSTGATTPDTEPSHGLARVTQPSTGVFVLFSTGVGQVALDSLGTGDPDPNSVFTRTLVPLLTTPGLDVVHLARRVREQVSALAASVSVEQEPAYFDSSLGEIVLSR